MTATVFRIDLYPPSDQVDGKVADLVYLDPFSGEEMERVSVGQETNYQILRGLMELGATLKEAAA